MPSESARHTLAQSSQCCSREQASSIGSPQGWLQSQYLRQWSLFAKSPLEGQRKGGGCSRQRYDKFTFATLYTEEVALVEPRFTDQIWSPEQAGGRGGLGDSHYYGGILSRMSIIGWRMDLYSTVAAAALLLSSPTPSAAAFALAANFRSLLSSRLGSTFAQWSTSLGKRAQTWLII
ncbi:hypothetical protein TYRP_020963 [Tyrophagus putrescentiae]|nr:hypothetical protein TYRP_020963 [Tyrophagus putrescentiae]